MIPNIKNENDLRRLAGIPIKEDPIDIPPDDDDEAEDWGVPSKPSGSIDNIIAKHREEFESVMRGESSLYDHDEFYDELYEHYVNSGEMPYGIAKARDGDPDQWIQEELDREYGDDFATDDGEPMDGDFDSGMASAGLGTDEDYGYYGESKEPKTFKEHLQAVQEGSAIDDLQDLLPSGPTRLGKRQPIQGLSSTGRPWQADGSHLDHDPAWLRTAKKYGKKITKMFDDKQVAEKSQKKT